MKGGGADRWRGKGVGVASGGVVGGIITKLPLLSLFGREDVFKIYRKGDFCFVTFAHFLTLDDRHFPE